MKEVVVVMEEERHAGVHATLQLFGQLTSDGQMKPREARGLFFPVPKHILMPGVTETLKPKGALVWRETARWRLLGVFDVCSNLSYSEINVCKFQMLQDEWILM